MKTREREVFVLIWGRILRRKGIRRTRDQREKVLIFSFFAHLIIFSLSSIQHPSTPSTPTRLLLPFARSDSLAQDTS